MQRHQRAVHGYMVLPMTHGQTVWLALPQFERVKVFLGREGPFLPLYQQNFLFGQIRAFRFAVDLVDRTARHFCNYVQGAISDQSRLQWIRFK